MNTVLSLYVSGDFMGGDKGYVLPMGCSGGVDFGTGQTAKPASANSKAYIVHILAFPPSQCGTVRLASSFMRTSRPSFAGRPSVSWKAWNRPSRGAHKRCSRASSDAAVSALPGCV
jgi:hypothetical protein